MSKPRETTTFVVEASPVLLPRYVDMFNNGWVLDEDLGRPLPACWDPTEFFAGLKVGCVHAEGENYLVCEELVKRLRTQMGERHQFDQYVLDWVIDNWDDPRIPQWFKVAIEEDFILIIATGTTLVYWRGAGVSYASAGTAAGRSGATSGSTATVVPEAAVGWSRPTPDP